MPRQTPAEGTPVGEALVQAGVTLHQCPAGRLGEEVVHCKPLLGQKGGRSQREGKVRAKPNSPSQAGQETQTCL